MRRISCFLVLVLSVMAVLSGCGGGDNQNADAGKKKLVLWHIETDKRGEVINAAVERFKKKHPDVDVEVVQQENDPYKTKLSVAMGGGNPPDVFTSWGGGWLEQFVKSGQVLDLTGKIDKESYVPAALSASTFDGKIYGAPLGMAAVPVWYNKEIFAKYHLTPPKTYSELLMIIKTLKQNNIIPFALANQTKWPGAFYLMYFADRLGGAEVFNKAYKRQGGSFDDPAFIKAGEMIQDLVKAGAFPNGFNGLNYDTGQSRQLFYSGKAAMEIMGSWYIDNIRTEAPGFEKKVDIFPFPAIEGGKGDISDIVGGVTPVFSVSTKSKYPDLAVELVKELTSKETAQANADTGMIPAVKGVQVKDPLVKRILDLLNQAKYMQTYYDQTLPPELAELHKDTTQALFGLTMTPENAAKAMEQKAKEVLKK